MWAELRTQRWGYNPANNAAHDSAHHSKRMKLIIGLGNPGSDYEKTRHNAGFMAVDQLIEAFSFSAFKKEDKFKSLISEGQIAGEKVLLVKPLTFMNLSGQAAQALMSYYKVDPKDLLVLYDDVEIPLGSIRLRPTGTAGGQKGMASIIQELGTADIQRIKIGIKPEKPFPGELSDFVLGRFSTNEQIQLDDILDKIPSVIELILKEGIETGMNQFN